MDTVEDVILSELANECLQELEDGKTTTIKLNIDYL